MRPSITSLNTNTIERIVNKLETLSVSDIIDIETILDGYVAESVLPKETLQALKDVENDNVIKCTSLDELFNKLEI